VPLTEEPLPPYTGERTQCSKCGSRRAYTRYRPEVTEMVVRSDGDLESREHLRRTCSNCDYEWNEALVVLSNDYGAIMATRLADLGEEGEPE
jgi:predicted nucleic-acid-binding Zn-ribbon protein